MLKLKKHIEEVIKKAPNKSELIKIKEIVEIIAKIEANTDIKLESLSKEMRKDVN